MSQKQKLEEEKACQILNAVIEALDYVAANPQLLPKLAYELIQKAPAIYEAMMTITIPEHRNIIHELFIKSLNLIGKLKQPQNQ